MCVHCVQDQRPALCLEKVAPSVYLFVYSVLWKTCMFVCVCVCVCVWVCICEFVSNNNVVPVSPFSTKRRKEKTFIQAIMLLCRWTLRVCFAHCKKSTFWSSKKFPKKYFIKYLKQTLTASQHFKALIYVRGLVEIWLQKIISKIFGIKIAMVIWLLFRVNSF